MVFKQDNGVVRSLDFSIQSVRFSVLPFLVRKDGWRLDSHGDDGISVGKLFEHQLPTVIMDAF